MRGILSLYGYCKNASLKKYGPVLYRVADSVGKFSRRELSKNSINAEFLDAPMTFV